MFNEMEKINLPVVMTLQDGRTLVGDLIVNVGGTIERTLNNDSTFVMFGYADGSQRFLAKSTILEVESNRNGTANQSTSQPGIAGAAQVPGQPDDPYAILGVPSSATQDEIRVAYIEKAQAYNPDRFASVGLPAEVAAFSNEMFSKISAAYSELTEGQTLSLAASA